MKLESQSLNLLKLTTENLMVMLSQDNSLKHVRQNAFDDLIGDENIQIHVLVTRDNDDFLEFLQTEEMREYKPENP